MKKVAISKKAKFIYLTFLLIVSASCSTISTYDQQAYSQTINTKVETINLMSLATSEYATYEKDVKELKLKLLKCKEYAAHRPKNEISTEMWAILIDKEGHLIGGFMSRWEKENTLSPTFVRESQKIVAKAFDQIAELESKKIKAKDI